MDIYPCITVSKIQLIYCYTGFFCFFDMMLWILIAGNALKGDEDYEGFVLCKSRIGEGND